MDEYAVREGDELSQCVGNGVAECVVHFDVSTTRRVQAVKPRAAKKRRKSVFIARLNDEK